VVGLRMGVMYGVVLVRLGMGCDVWGGVGGIGNGV
jgi:hypothetical protein